MDIIIRYFFLYKRKKTHGFLFHTPYSLLFNMDRF